MSTPSSASTSPSTIRSQRGLATHSSAHPSARSLSSSAYCDASPKSTSPSTISALHVPQVPCVHACGNQIPSRRQASSTVWSARQLTSAPRGSTLTLYAVTVASPSGLRTAVALYVPRRVRPAIDPRRDRSPRRTTASCAPRRHRSRDLKRPRDAPPSTGTRRKPLLSVPESKPPNIAAGCRPTVRIPADRRRRPRRGRQRESRSRITLSRSFHCSRLVGMPRRPCLLVGRPLVFAVVSVLDAVPGQHFRDAASSTMALVNLVHRKPGLHVLLWLTVENPLAAIATGVERLATELAAAQTDLRWIGCLTERHRDLADLAELRQPLEENPSARRLDSPMLLPNRAVVTVERLRILFGQPRQMRFAWRLGGQRGSE